MNLYSEEAKRQRFSIPLHALRGVAAIVVLFNHMHERIDEAFPQFMFTHIINGSAAVIFFYVLSGLVVGASLAKTGISYSSTATFFHRRFFRIMPLMFVTVTIGGLYLLYIDPYMKYSLIPKEYGEFTLLKFITSYVGYSLKPNPPIWSIFVELVASLLIPLMILFGNKIIQVILVFAACVVLSFIPINFHHHWNFYMICFFLGLSVLIWGRWFSERISELSTTSFWLLVTMLFVLFYSVRRITGAGFGDLWIVYWETAFVTPLVAIIYYMPERFSLLSSKAFAFLGDISFSLYLTHFLLLIVLLNSVTSLFGNTGLAALLFCGLSVVCCVLIAWISYRNIEVKGIKLGENIRNQCRPVTDIS